MNTNTVVSSSVSSSSASSASAASVAEYVIPGESMGKFRKEIERLARKAQKQGFAPPAFEITGSTVKFMTVNGGTKLIVPCEVVRLTSEPFGIEGFTFIARLEHVSFDGAGTIIHAVPGENVPAEYRKASGEWCDHCRAKRNRNDTFLLRKDADGSHVQVGRQCVVDYIGHNAASVAAGFEGHLSAIHAAESYAWDDSMSMGGGGIRAYAMVSDYMPLVAYVVREYGWVSKKSAYETGGKSTHDRCVELDGCVRPLAEDHELAEKAIEWARSLPEDCNDYLHNLRVLAETNVLRGENRGLAASMISAYKNAIAPRPGMNSQYVGEVGARMILRLRVNRIHTFYTEFGTTNLHVMSDESDNVFVWKASSAPLKEGETYLLKGTVKAHNERNGVKQTMLSRCEEVSFLRFIVTVGGADHEVEAESEKAAKDAAKAKLGLARMPKGVVVRQV